MRACPRRFGVCARTFVELCVCVVCVFWHCMYECVYGRVLCFGTVSVQLYLTLYLCLSVQMCLSLCLC